MFASVNIFTNPDSNVVAVPRDAVVQDGATSRVWVVREDRTIELRQIKVGVSNGQMIQVVEGLAPGDNIIVRGSLFLDRAVAAS